VTDHFDGRFPGLFAAAHEPAHPSPFQGPHDTPGEPAPLGPPVRRGVHGLHQARAEAPARRTLTAMPDPARPGPRRSALARTFCLEPVLSSVAVARRAVAALVAEWGTAVDVDTAILLTSELVANAVTHGGVPGKPVLLAVFDLGGRLHVEVHDPGGCGVECKRPTLDGESGRGLAIVAALADFWDWEPTSWGKVVYFALSAASEARAA